MYSHSQTTPRPAVTVIVPVFNAAKTLARCLDSILGQTFEDFEAVLVNDGSTDESPDICRQYAQRDARIKVYDRQNHGVGATRQFGIEHAAGTYSIHADSDDWIEPEMLEELYRTAEKTHADLVIADFYAQQPGGEERIVQKPSAESDPDSVLRDILTGKLHGSTCNKLLRTELYRTFGISFPAGVNYCEDTLIWVQLLQHPVKIVYLPKAFYHYDYLTNPDSITRNYTRKTFGERVRFIERLQALLPPAAYAREIAENRVGVKYELFLYGILGRREYRRSLPIRAGEIVRSRHSPVTRLLLLMAEAGAYRTARGLYKLKTRCGRLIRR